MAGDIPRRLGDLADHGRARAARDARQRVFIVVDRQQRRRERRRHDPAQPLLRLADRDDFRRQIALRGRHAIKVHLGAHPAGRAQLRAAPSEPARAEVLEPGRDALRTKLREHRVRRAHDHVLQERIRYLDGAFVLIGIIFVERQRRERRAAEAAAIGRLSDEHDVPAHAALRRARVDDVFFLDEPECDDVDEHVVVERLVEEHVAPDVGHADCVAVRGDAVDDLLRDVTAVLVLQPAEAQRVGDADHFRTHAQHVAYDPADAGRGPLERHDLRRMVVRLVRDDDSVGLAVPLAEPHDAGVLADAQQHGGPFRRQLAQMLARRLVGAMLAPLRVEREQLGVGRQAAEVLGDAPQLVVGERDPDLATARDDVVEHARRLRHVRRRAGAAAAAR